MSARSASDRLAVDDGMILLDRHRLAGERRLVHAQVARAQEAQVGRHLVAGLHQHEVAGDDLGGREPHLLPGAQQRGLRRHRAAERVDGGHGLGLLQVADDAR